MIYDIKKIQNLKVQILSLKKIKRQYTLPVYYNKEKEK